MTGGPILVVPCCEKGKGGGHLNRCISLTNDLRALGCEAWLYLQEKTDKIANLLQSKNFNTSWIISDEQTNRPFELVILDRYQTPRDELVRWKKIAPVIGIDEGGRYRDGFDFLIDILIPEKADKPYANISSPSLLPFPKKSKLTAQKTEKLKILISFGHEDCAGLGLAVANALGVLNDDKIDITLLKGGLNSTLTASRSIKILDTIPNLAERLHEYDLVFTHYGITAYETLYAGIPVLLVNPTHYHEKISKLAGFNTFPIKLTQKRKNSEANEQITHKFNASRLCALVNQKSINKLTEHCKGLAVCHGLDKKTTTLADLINSFSAQFNSRCPVCGKETNNRSIARFPECTYHFCPNCGIISMDRIKPAPIEYEKEYFFESYKKQYGKTYLEDFPNLVAMAKCRLLLISRMTPHKDTKGYSPLLLDIGCAYGPFLFAAREEGFTPSGIDPAHDAVLYVQEALGIPAIQGFFPNCRLPTPHSSFPTPHLYDVITLWYVIEHFRDPAAVLAEIKKLLKLGGILAFSTPSFSGISGRKSLRKFLEKSPADHYTIWSPKTCKKALAFAGFKVKKIVTSGHHPERFPLLGKFAGSKKSPLYCLLLVVSKIFGLSDTFEVYAKLG